MATPHSNSALRAPASPRPYPMAKPGYGKRSMPDQRPRSAHDFALLPARERYVAGFVDQLPDGASMDVKSLAKQLPLYGQQAVGSALRALATAGHLRRVRCLVGESGQVRWVSRTFWSRTARDNEWWAATEVTVTLAAAPAIAPATELVHTEPAPPPVPPAAPAAPATPPTPAAPAVPQQRAPGSATAPEAPSPAYLALARLGRVDSRLALSAADCAALESRAAEWLARGVDADYLTQALTAGLPDRVGSPVGLVRRRLTDKIPPHAPTAPTPPAPGAPVRLVMLECTECGTPGRPEALPDGLCRPCRSQGRDTALPAADHPSEEDVRAFAAGLRDMLKSP
ncbi:MarR family transcriptional regulator [Streptomyces sp. NBC_01201]|uniref:MarR family transcriptional regulator n=1 Tax=unclassified Streptomyces TaxID=2593676 RepID=UPI002E148DF4|nr:MULTISPECIES: MarR family transcriptional regulator [unclassified Streptomyces]WSQ79642.1 MarR family transcriptional regulator [Streptomyces sp. NBC_01213]WSR06958.1 MarR family transcriptional regulator [Streptomyces sp. NBC_01208]WSR50299.1 MarR family transcriptional regulator [Streptomyces sp. NBC_01201]